MGDTCPICDKGILEMKSEPLICNGRIVESDFLECTNPKCPVNNKEIQE